MSEADLHGQRWGQRHLLIVMMALGMFNIYAVRSNLGITVLPMSCSFGWSHVMQGQLLSAFFWGYILLQVAGGLLAQRVGGKVVFGGCVFMTALTSILIPFVSTSEWTQEHVNCQCPVATHQSAERWCISGGAYLHGASCMTLPTCFSNGNFRWVVALRVATGFFESLAAPSVLPMLSCWGRRDEYSFMNAFVGSGSALGNAVTLPLSGWMVTQPGRFGGWPSVFYLFSFLSFAWAMVWFWPGMISSMPETHDRISQGELEYIVANRETRQMSSWWRIPVRSMFSSHICWAIFIAHFCAGWAVNTFVTFLPMFIHDRFRLNPATTGVIACAPWIGEVIIEQVAGAYVDMRIRAGTSRSFLRKAAQCGAFLPPAVMLVLCSYCSNGTLVVFFLIMAVALQGLNASGFGANFLDVAPSNAGVLYGISNTLATLSGIIAPTLIGHILGEEAGITQWRAVFWIGASILTGGAVTFAAAASGELQPELEGCGSCQDKAGAMLYGEKYGSTGTA